MTDPIKPERLPDEVREALAYINQIQGTIAAKDAELATAFRMNEMQRKVFDDQCATIADSLTRKQLADWMIAHGIVTGHGDTVRDLLAQLGGAFAADRATVAAKDAALRAKVDRFLAKYAECEPYLVSAFVQSYLAEELEALRHD
tara:strand:+ start:428 stop:862 length:435 start_codon:yes stop_codon:yes gene_type:complete